MLEDIRALQTNSDIRRADIRDRTIWTNEYIYYMRKYLNKYKCYCAKAVDLTVVSFKLVARLCMKETREWLELKKH